MRGVFLRVTNETLSYDICHILFSLCNILLTHVIQVYVSKSSIFFKEKYPMKRNMSDVDRIVRVILAALFAYLYFGGIVTGTLGIVLVVLGAIFLLTALVAFCPLYAPFQFSTYKK